MIGRRRFLKMIGISSVSAKAALDSEVTSLTALRGSYAPAMAVGRIVSHGNEAPAVSGYNNGRYVQMSDYVRMFGRLPAHVDRDARERSKHVSHLDPDIACKKSWSMSVKIMTQQQRNYEADICRYRDMGWYERAQDTFEKALGFRWSQW